jgi:uncharacterized protein YlxW (UPF0749 family)
MERRGFFIVAVLFIGLVSLYLLLHWVLGVGAELSWICAVVVWVVFAAHTWPAGREKGVHRLPETFDQRRKRLRAGLRDIGREQARLDQEREEANRELASLERPRAYRVADPPEDAEGSESSAAMSHGMRQGSGTGGGG